jgi:hypothetical protein
VRDDHADEGIHGRAGLDQQEYLARAFQVGHEFFDAVAADDILCPWRGCS